MSHFLNRDYNKAFAEVTGDRGGGYGVEVPCCYRFYGPELYVKRMKAITTSLASQGLIQLVASNNHYQYNQHNQNIFC